jgi:hypothetical protein
LRRYSRVELGDALEKKLGLNWRICWGQIRVGYFRAEFQSDKETIFQSCKEYIQLHETP